jgi:hypothetical protein
MQISSQPNPFTSPLPVINGLSIPAWNSSTQTQATLTDTWVFKLGTTTVATVVITYTDSTKEVISTVVKT